MNYTMYLDYLNNVSKEQGIPFQGDFELTGNCNLNCKFCYVSSKSVKVSQNLATEQWLSIIGQAAEAGMIRATFTGGEVLTRPDFEELYCKTYDMGVRILILTNGLLMNEHFAEIFKKRPPEGISMTLYGSNNDDYKRVTGNPIGFDMAIEAIELMKGYMLPLSLKTIALPDLMDSFKSIRDLSDKYSLDLDLVRYISPKRNNIKELDLKSRLDAQIIGQVIKIIDTTDSVERIAPKSKSGFLDCNCGKGRFAVCYDGRMVGCLSYTELYTFPLIDGFNNALIKLRDLIKNQTEICMECSTCVHRSQCTMCPGLNYAESGSLSICSEYRKQLAKNSIL